MRVPGSKIYVSMWKNLKSNPTPMAWGEVFTSLQLGTIDGIEQPIPVIVSHGMDEVIKYATLSNYLTGFVFVAMNKDFFEKLPANYQKLVVEAAEKANDFKYDLDIKNQETALTTMKAKGMDIYVPTKEELLVFQQAVRPTWDEYQDIIGRDLLNKTLDVIKSLEKKEYC
jgi:TRAP-type C4-dicarboxylate transport system substrate-binding protein